MRKVLLMVAVSACLSGCYGTPENPLLAEWDTPLATPPFDRIESIHFEPAFAAARQDHEAEIAAVVANNEPPNFTNTIEALDRSGELLARVRAVFNGLNGAVTSEEMQAVAKQVMPQLSRHKDTILLNTELFARIEAVHQQRGELDLDSEQMRLLTETYKRFVRGGARLDAEDKARLATLNERLALLRLQFSENVLKETNRFAMVLEDEADLAGLPAGVVAAAAEAAVERGYEGQWVFTIHKPSLIPFLQYSERRDLRQKMLMAYADQGNHGDELDNKANLLETVQLRAERARLLGYESHAHYVLADNMAGTPEAVYARLQEIWQPARARAQEEVAEMQAIIDREAEWGGEQFTLAAWDWWFYAEKLKAAKYSLDEEMLRPYFQVEKVRQGMFAVAGKLFGLSFAEREDISRYHPEVRTFEVTDASGELVAVLYLDYFPRESKRGGAWMDAFRKQQRKGGERVAPLIFNVGNFTSPTGDTPALLSVDEVLTMFHEFGHALHGMLSQCTYRSLSGTSVARDFVELPSQIMENWALEPAVLELYAQHWQTGETIPRDLIEKLNRTKTFNQGFAVTEYLSAAFLDMDWHVLTADETDGLDATDFERLSLSAIDMIPEIIVRYRSPYFKHVFGGGYSAGYYAYVWAEVLDADAYAAFKETGDIFDQQTADAFKRYILEKGGSEDPMELYRKFRGQEPGIEPYLERKGMSEG